MESSASSSWESTNFLPFNQGRFGGMEGPPDLVVEVASPATASRDRGAKLDRYRHHGVAEYWIADPDAGAVEVWHLADGATEPEVLGTTERLVWTPAATGPTLHLDVADIIREP